MIQKSELRFILCSFYIHQRDVKSQKLTEDLRIQLILGVELEFYDNYVIIEQITFSLTIDHYV